jgi:hypothetical protein
MDRWTVPGWPAQLGRPAIAGQCRTDTRSDLASGTVSPAEDAEFAEGKGRIWNSEGRGISTVGRGSAEPFASRQMARVESRHEKLREASPYPVEIGQHEGMEDG